MIGHDRTPCKASWRACWTAGRAAGWHTNVAININQGLLPPSAAVQRAAQPPSQDAGSAWVAVDLGNRVNPGPLSLALVDGVDGEGNEGCPSEQPDGQPDASCITITSIIRVALGCTPLAGSAGLRVNLIADVFTELRGAKLLADGRCAQEPCEQLHPARTTDHPNHEPLDVCNQ